MYEFLLQWIKCYCASVLKVSDDVYIIGVRNNIPILASSHVHALVTLQTKGGQAPVKVNWSSPQLVLSSYQHQIVSSAMLDKGCT